MGNEWILRVAKKCRVTFFIGLFMSKKGILGFWEGFFDLLPKLRGEEGASSAIPVGAK